MSRIESMDLNGSKAPISAEQMRALEARAMNSGRVAGIELMERAGAGIVSAIQNSGITPVSGAGRAVILCGPGNNGGDGFVVARLLAALGWAVDVFSLGEAEQLPPDARSNYLAWLALGEVRPLDEAPNAMAGADLVVDGLFGIGLTRVLSAQVGEVLAAVPESAHRVAIDVPSGWDADGAGMLGDHGFIADQVVTFHVPKQVHETLSEHGVRIDVVDIGL